MCRVGSVDTVEHRDRVNGLLEFYMRQTHMSTAVFLL